MCGLIALVALQQQKLSAATIDSIDNSLEQIKHRGPDSQGKWISPSGRIALGHVRLRINDLSPTGHQPLHDDEQTIHAVVNGEIYEYDRLRAEMVEKLHYRFQGTSDCELVLALYKYYGLSFLSHLRGEFSLCLYDSTQDTFIAARDRYGIKPLFWTVLGGELLIAAEIKAFTALGWKPEWDVKGIVDGSYQMGSGTIFKGVRKVIPGHFLICDKSGKIHDREYWDMTYPRKQDQDNRTEVEMVQGLRSQLLDAIRVRLRADVKVGVALSGGIDSSVIAGMVNHLIREGEQVGSDVITERLSCFGVAFDEDSGFDESSTANATADFLGVKYYKKHMNEQALADSFEDATWMNEQPNPDLNFIGLYALSELVREQGFRVILNGQGSDEIFGGYPLFLPDLLLEADSSSHDAARMSDAARKTELIKAVDRLTQSGPSERLTQLLFVQHPTLTTLTPTFMADAYPVLPLHHNIMKQTGNSCESHWSHQPRMPYLSALPNDTKTKISGWHPFHRGQYIFTKAHLENLILSNLGDRGEMAHSIEGRTPFLDHHLTEYVNSLPPSMKIRARLKPATAAGNGTHISQELIPEGENYEFIAKYVLREAARPFVTDEIYNKRKHPYSAPLHYNIDGPLHRLMQKLVTEPNIADLGFLAWRSEAFHNGKSLGDLVHLAFAEKDETVFRLVICLAQWIVLSKKFGVRKASVPSDGLKASL